VAAKLLELAKEDAASKYFLMNKLASMEPFQKD
jgi:hypothetical protein